MINNKKMGNDRKTINNRRISMIVAFCMTVIIIFLTAPELFVQAAEETWKTVTDPTSVGSSIYAYGDEYLVTQDGSMSLLDQNMDVICTYDKITYYYDGYYKVTDDGNIFIINNVNQIVIPSGYDSIGYYGGVGNYISVRKDGKYGLININNETILSCSYDSIITNVSTPTTGIVMVKNYDKYGLVNINSEIVVNIEYTSISVYSDTSKGTVCYMGTKDGLKCVFDNVGNQIIALGECSSISYINEMGVLKTFKNSQYGLIATDGTVILENKCSGINTYGKNIIEYTAQDTPGIFTKHYMNRSGENCNIPINSTLSAANDGYYKLTQIDGKRYYITLNEDGTLNYFGDTTYDDISYFGNGIFRLLKGNDEALMDAAGNIIIAYQNTYNFTSSFSNGMFLIYKTVPFIVDGINTNTDINYYGVVSKNGTIVIPVIYYKIYFNKSTGIIEAINNKGLPTAYFHLSEISEYLDKYDAVLKIEETGGYRVLKNGKFGVINSSFDVIIPLEYDMITYIGDNNFKVVKNAKYGVIDSSGTIVKACLYSNVFTFNYSFKSKVDLNSNNHNITKDTAIIYNSESVKDDRFRISDLNINFTYVNETKQLSITTETLNTSGLLWSSDNEGVATVNSTGLVTAIGIGTAKITAVNGSLTATCEVTVTVIPLPPLSIVAQASVSKNVIGDNVTISATGSGGAGGYKYKILLYNKDTGVWQMLQDFDIYCGITITSSSAGNRDYYVDVKDEVGTIVRSSAMNVVTSKPIVALSISVDASTSSNNIRNKVTFTATGAGGTGSYTYKYLVYNKTTAVWALLQDYSSNSTLTWTAGSIGAREFYVDIKDASGKVVRSKAMNVTTTIPVTTEALSISATGSATANNVGNIVTFTAIGSGGSGGYTYKFLLYNKISGVWEKLQDFSNNASISWTATSIGTREFYVDVKDSSGKVVRSTAMNVITTKPVTTKALSISATGSATANTIGNKVTFTAIGAGGSGGYTYKFLVYNKITGVWTKLQDFSNNASVSWTATSIGTREFYVDVQDSSGKVVRSVAMNLVTTAANNSSELAITAIASMSNAVIGNKVTFTAIGTGGSGSYTYKFLVYNKTTNTWAALQDFGDLTSFTWTAGSIGNREFYVDVKDSTGKSVRSTVMSVVIK